MKGESLEDKSCTKCGEPKELDAFEKMGGDKRTAICRACINTRRKKSRAAKAAAKIDPSVHNYGLEQLPENYGIKGISQYVGADGKIKGQWIKSERDKQESLAELIEALQDIMEPYRGRAELVPAPAKVSSAANLLNILPIGDAHIGLLAWWQETGESFDLQIAERLMRLAFDKALAVAPKAETLMIVSVGDYFHTDGGQNTTSKGTKVDVDGRWPKVLRVGLRILRYAIERGLETHQNVHVKCAQGNHDVEATTTLVVALSMLFEGNPRVVFDEAPTKHHYYRHGRCLIGITHSDTGKLSDLPMVMAVDRQQDWGDTDFRHWYLGHFHHDKKISYDVQEMHGCSVEVVRTLAATDAWHRGMGYRSGRDIKIDTWHKTRGMKTRNVIGISELEED